MILLALPDACDPPRSPTVMAPLSPCCDGMAACCPTKDGDAVFITGLHSCCDCCSCIGTLALVDKAISGDMIERPSESKVIKPASSSRGSSHFSNPSQLLFCRIPSPSSDNLCFYASHNCCCGCCCCCCCCCCGSSAACTTPPRSRLLTHLWIVLQGAQVTGVAFPTL